MINKSDIQRDVLAALRDLGDIRDAAVTYSRSTPGDYDPDGDTVNSIVTTVTCPALFTDYSTNEIRLAEGRIQREDRRVLIIPSELDFTPQFGDTMTRSNGETWVIPKDGSITKDPSDALWLIQVRKLEDINE